MIFQLVVNFKPADTRETISFFISDTGGSEKKSESSRLDLCSESSDFLFRATCVKTAFLKIIFLHQKPRYQSDPIRSDPESDPDFVDGRKTYTVVTQGNTGNQSELQ